MRHGKRSGSGPGSILPPRDEWRPSLRGLPIDETAGAVVVDGVRVAFQPHEQAALHVLLIRDWVSVDTLLTALYGRYLEAPDTCVSVVRVVVSTLRRKLLRSGAVIITLYRVGYRLDAPANDDRPLGERVHPSSQGNAA